MTFKVGDKVRRVETSGNSTTPVGFEGVIRYIENDGDVMYHFDNGAWGYDDEYAEWELANATPVITVTRREVNPGTYGPLRVLGTVNLPDCSRPDTPYTKAVDIELTETTLDADQLAVLVAHLQEIIGALRDAQ